MISTRWKSLGPILLSAFSILITFLLVQPIACWLDSSFTLLASRSVGKIALTILVMNHILLLMLMQPRAFLQDWFTTNIGFFKNFAWLKLFFSYFTIFFLLHSTLLGFFFWQGYATYNAAWGIITPSLGLKMLFGFLVVFLLAWTEELIFRGTVYKFLAQYLCPLESVFITSLIFMLAHDLTNPLNLVTIHWQLGLGLFLLGFLLNLTLVITEKLYTGMGIHAGLVFVKVVLRRARFFVMLPATQIPWFVHEDLRQSILVHVLFALVNLTLIIKFRKKLLKKHQ